MISFIIPTYNSAWNIERLIRSILPQKAPEDEILIVDDGSRDDTRRLATSFESQRVRVLEMKQNSGPAAARNRGAREAKGDYLFFLDSDTELEAGSVHAFRKMITERPQIACVNGMNQRGLDSSIGAQYKALLEHSWVAETPNFNDESTCFNTRVGAIRRDLFLETGGFNETYKKADVEDYELGYALIQKTKIYLNKDLKVKHRFGNLAHITRNYFKRTALWLNLFLERKSFDGVGGTSFGSALESILGFLAASLTILCFFHPAFVVLAGFAWAGFLFKARSFLRLVLLEKGWGYAFLFLFIHLYFSFVIVISSVWGLFKLSLPHRGYPDPLKEKLWKGLRGGRRPTKQSVFEKQIASDASRPRNDDFPYGIRPGAEDFPLQVIVSIIYPCNLGCPYCPYTDGNSDLRKFYNDAGGNLIPPDLFRKIADECAPYGAFIRCTGGGEPTLHPEFFNMVEYAKGVGARIWLNTNGTVLGPHNDRTKRNLERLMDCGCDLIEFSVDAGDPQTYDIVRPARRGQGNPERWKRLVAGIRYAVEYRNQRRSSTRIVTSLIMHDLLIGKAEAAVRFWLEGVGVDEVIRRKYLTWDDNTNLKTSHSLDARLYADEGDHNPPCVWPFERMNIDTLGRVALCGQDISFRTSVQFPNVKDSSIKEIWQGETFAKYRKMHLEGRGEDVEPCSHCSAWKAGIRDWQHGWLKVLNTAEKHRQQVLSLGHFGEVGMETERCRP